MAKYSLLVTALIFSMAANRICLKRTDIGIFYLANTARHIMVIPCANHQLYAYGMTISWQQLLLSATETSNNKSCIHIVKRKKLIFTRFSDRHMKISGNVKINMTTLYGLDLISVWQMVYQPNRSQLNCGSIRDHSYSLTFLIGFHKNRAWGNILKHRGIWGWLHGHARTSQCYLTWIKWQLTEALTTNKSGIGGTRENSFSCPIGKLQTGNGLFTSLL